MRVPVLLLTASLTFLAGLGRPAIGDADEGFYAEAAREMVESGDWLTPHFNYEHRFEKPILYYWLTAATYRVAGVTPAAARLWAALAGVGLVLLTYACAARWYGVKTAFLAGAIVATSFGYFEIARQGLPDLPLTFFVTLTVWAAFRGLAPLGDERTAGASPDAWFVLAGAAAALGFLTKGPIALVVPGIVVVPALAWEWWSSRDRESLPGRHLRLRNWAAACAVLAGLAAPWYLAMAHEHGLEYLHRFFIGENVERFATERFNEPRPFWFYLPVLLGGLLPWSPYLLLGVPALTRAFGRRWDPETARLLFWTAMPLLFFTLSVGKQPRYILPILPPLAMLIARLVVARLDALERDVRRPDRLIRLCTAVAGGLLVLLGGLVQRAGASFEAAGLPLVTVVAVAIMSAGAAVILVAWLGPARWHPASVAAAAVVVLLSLQYGILSSPGPDPVERMAALVRSAHAPGRALGVYGVFNRNLIFYTGLRQIDIFTDEQLLNFLRSGEPVLCVLTADVLDRVARPRELTLRHLGEVRHLNTANIRPGTILRPDPDRDVQRVLLVTNR